MFSFHFTYFTTKLLKNLGPSITVAVTKIFSHIKLGGTGIVSTVAGALAAKEYTIKAGGTVSGNNTFTIDPAAATDPWHQTADSAALTATQLVLNYITNSISVGSIFGSGFTNGFSIRMATTKVLTAAGDWNFGTKAVAANYGSGARSFTVNMAAYALTCGNISIGTNLQADSITFNFGSGHHNISGTVAEVAGNTGTTTLALGTSSITLGTAGVIDGTDITFTATNAVIVGGTINDADFTGLNVIHLYPQAAGSNNTNVFEVSPNQGGLSLGMGLAA